MKTSTMVSRIIQDTQGLSNINETEYKIIHAWIYGKHVNDKLIEVIYNKYCAKMEG